jgi:hypothetical protein
MKLEINYHLSLKNRIIISITLLIILLGLCFYYNDNFEVNAQYPSAKSILLNYPEGETVYISGNFAGDYNGGFYLKDDSYGKVVTYKINSSYKGEDGDIISILGTLGPSFTITPQEMVINKEWKEYFLLFRSAVIGIILFFIFWKYWKFDFKNMEFTWRK